MTDAYTCDYIRIPIGRFGGSFVSSVRADDLGAVPHKALAARNPGMDLSAIDEVIFECANQAGEDNLNVARMSLLLADYPDSVPGTTMNRLCGSGMTDFFNTIHPWGLPSSAKLRSAMYLYGSNFAPLLPETRLIGRELN